MFTRPRNYSTDETIRPGDRNRLRRFAPILLLFVLPPVVAEVLFGATPVSNLGALLPITALYGSGVVLIRELARRRGTGWARIALLGAAYAVVEEGLALQSMFNPDLFNAGTLGGRALGINWVWSEWTIGYHIVWSISVPILLAELLFPTRRTVPWLGRTGVAVVGTVYVLGALGMAAIFRLIITPDFRTPTVLAVAAVMVIVGLVALALAWPADTPPEPSTEPMQDAPSPWLVGLVVFVVCSAWFGLLGLPGMLRAGALVLVPMVLGVALVAGVLTLLRRWSAPHRRWTDLHRLALAAGALLSNTLIGFFFVTAGSPVDQAGVAFTGAVAAVLFALFAWRLSKRASEVGPVRGADADTTRSDPENASSRELERT
jgi:hypothetical protein